MRKDRMITILLMGLFIAPLPAFPQKKAFLVQDENRKTLLLSDSSGDLVLRLNYSGGCMLDEVIVNGTEVTGNGNTVYSGVRFRGQLRSSKHTDGQPGITVRDNTVRIDGIRFGDTAFAVEEDWIFTIGRGDIQWRIDRRYLNSGVIDEDDFPCWQFNSMQTWDGALLDNGGVAWNRFLDEPGDSYGAHAGALTCWNRSRNSCLRIGPDDDPAVFRAVTFRHQADHVWSVIQSSSTGDINTQHELMRFVKGGKSVFAPIAVHPSAISIHYTLRALSYDRAYGRGMMKGINGSSVNEMLNTIGRYGVVDKYLYGANGWRTGYVVLQEPWFALSGLAIDAPDYINGFSQALEYERDHAVMPDGRVLPRWHHDSSDAMPHTFRDDGFYECMWGYMLDAQPAYAINVAEQFDMNGDTAWLRRLKSACERALGYMIRKDSDGNGLFEVVQKTHKEHKGADWMDIVWTSYEVASINAGMYEALIRWSGLEALLGDREMSGKYQYLAAKVKKAFNRNVADGGFWNPDKKWYVYWREKDGAVYGDNLATNVNFLAIGYGLCDDPARKAAILNNVEALMRKEKLFIWPSCFFPYEDGAGQSHSFPDYENGDLFLSWAELGTRCYAEDHPEIALKYIQNIIGRYALDGLAYQRYTRRTQSGAGEDILAGNIMAVVGLYRNIYGIRPRYNRLYLEPHLTDELNGTQLTYWLRNQEYVIGLSKEKHAISVNQFSVSSKHPFAINASGDELEYFNGDDERPSLRIYSRQPCSVDIRGWGKNNMQWKETPGNVKDKVRYELSNLSAGASYRLIVGGKPAKKYTADGTGSVRFDGPAGESAPEIQIVCIQK